MARIGGDEFIVLLNPSHCEDLMKSTQQNAELLLNSLSTMPITIHGNDHFVSASIGISFYPHHGTEMDSLLKKRTVPCIWPKSLDGKIFNTSTLSDHVKNKRLFS
ncbi:diguanylate cyclase [[Brevibacterium] frigoritolerans]|uniref:Diguanylate cyclase n=1 Tax=Peribacillus frigoritolerans TaxID=450367 RepID=A0A941J7Z0_9BACI|nr:diguanylate cyclase [Peribacillus frigoritolerans]